MSIPKIKLTFLLYAICYMLFANSPIAHATGEFSTSFHSDYQVNLEGLTTVTHNINITNLLSHLYTTEYTILIGNSELTEITAEQDGVIAEFIANTSSTGTSITVKNLTPVIGQGQTTTLTISYNTPDIAEILGRTWSINIPRLTHANEANEFVRTVRIPTSLGTPSAQYPEASSMTTNSGETTLIYKGHPNKSLTLLFGESEYYHLNLIYQISNPTLSSTDTEIALPPDTAYQRVILDSITPSPKHIKINQDGNWLAIYSLIAGDSLTVHASLYLEVFALPQTTSSIDDKKSLTRELPFWDTSSSFIIELADKLNTPLNIYNYLIENLIYDHSRLGNNPARLGAIKALESPNSALCTEYTDIFVSLTRTLDIPAREINGYAYTTNSSLRPLGVTTADILHAWPEYYDNNQSTWIQIDPTWGHTTGGVDYFHKLDFNHITFVIHGQESNYPLPAGTYKSDPSLSTIKVELTNNLPDTISKLDESITDNITTITNLGNTSVTHNDYGYLPPYGKHIITNSPLVSTQLIPNLYPWILLVIISLIVFALIHHHRKAS